MIGFQPGPGIYTAGFTLGADGGALAVLERRVHRIAPAPSANLYHGVPLERIPHDDRDAWQDSHALRYVETFNAARPRLETVRRVCDLIAKAPLRDETTLIVDVTELGATLRSLFYDDAIEGDSYWNAITLSDETTPAPGATSLADVRGAILALYEQGRLKMADRLPHKSEAIRALELASRGEPLTPIARAFGIACHYAAHSHTRQPWCGRQRPPSGSKAAGELEAWLMQQRLIDQAREHERKNNPPRSWRL